MKLPASHAMEIIPSFVRAPQTNGFVMTMRQNVKRRIIRCLRTCGPNVSKAHHVMGKMCFCRIRIANISITLPKITSVDGRLAHSASKYLIIRCAEFK